MDFKMGDTVQLKSGGPIMTIAEISSIAEGGFDVYCYWFVGPKREQGTFPSEAVKAAKPA